MNKSQEVTNKRHVKYAYYCILFKFFMQFENILFILLLHFLHNYSLPLFDQIPHESRQSFSLNR